MTFEQHYDNISFAMRQLDKALLAAKEDDITAQVSVVQPSQTTDTKFIHVTLSKGA